MIAQANAALDKSGQFADELVSCRHHNEFMLSPPDKIEYIDVAPSQIVSVAASLIPFLEHDDANRALMGSNMQRQAVPCLRAGEAARRHRHRAHRRDRLGHRGAAPPRRRGGLRRRRPHRGARQRRRDPRRAKSGVDIYNLTKYTRSNQNTNINQRPLVKVGDDIAKGDVLADGAVHRHGRARARAQHAGRVHAVERLQLRGLDPHFRARGGRGSLHHHPHRRAR